MAKKIKEELEIEKEENEEVEINQADKIAELTIDLDLQKEKYTDIEKKYNELQKKYEDEHKANMRLMDRISKREEMNEKQEMEKITRKASIMDLYDFESGKLKIKK